MEFNMDNDLRPLLNECIEILRQYAEFEVDERVLERTQIDGIADTTFSINETVRKPANDWLASRKLI